MRDSKNQIAPGIPFMLAGETAPDCELGVLFFSPELRLSMNATWLRKICRENFIGGK